MTDTQGRRSSHAPSSQQQTPPARQRNAQGKNLALSKLVISTALSLRHDKQQGVEDALVQRFSKHCIELIASVTGGKKISFFQAKTAQIGPPCMRTGRVKYSFQLKCVTKASEATVAWKEWRWSFFFFFYWELLKLKIPIYSHFPLEVCWGWLVPPLWYADGQLAFLRGTLAGGQGTQRRCPVRGCLRSSAELGANFVRWLQNKIPLLIVFPSNINVYIFTLLVISAGQ